MALTGIYTTRRGAGCTRPLNTLGDVEKLLRGGWSATSVEIKTASGELVGYREPIETADDRRVRWQWSYDQSAVSKALEAGRN